MIGNVYGFGSIKSRRYCNSNKKHDCVQRNANVCFRAYPTLLLCKTCEGVIDQFQVYSDFKSDFFK